jgi:hypothetical protein
VVAVYREHDHELDQGDLLDDVPFVHRRASEDPDVVLRRGLVTSHGCDCERYERRRRDGTADESFLAGYAVQVAPVLPAAEFNPGLMGDIRRGRVPQYFAIPEENPWPEWVVDLHQEQPIPVSDLLDCERDACLSDEMWRRLVVHRFYLQSRVKPETAFAGELMDEA